MASLSLSGVRHSSRGSDGARTWGLRARPVASAHAERRLNPTHFISLPIGHHPALRTRIAAFQNALSEMSPPLSGYDKSIVIDPRRLHLTLGVMTLTPEASTASASTDIAADPTSIVPEQTLTSALALLRSLKPRIMQILDGKRLRVGLDRLNIMDPERGNLEIAHVLWAGPNPAGEDAERLGSVCRLVHQTFKDAGFVFDKRPLKLHCTLLNTTHRKPRAQKRKPFSYSQILASDALKSITPTTTADPTPPLKISKQSHPPMVIDLGTWDIEEIQICVMGSHGPENEYVSSGGIELVTEGSS